MPKFNSRDVKKERVNWENLTAAESLFSVRPALYASNVCEEQYCLKLV